jgi:pyruvate,water dikinase
MAAAVGPDSFCVRLGAAAALAADRIGGKARSLVELAALGLPVPPAIAVTTDLFVALRADAPALPETLVAPNAFAELEQAARALAAAPWPAGFAETLAREADTLVPEPGARFSVRSSADVEDRAGALAAGLFLSRTNVGRGELLGAVRAVLGSALSPAVVAYLARRGLSAGALRFAVLIHPFVDGDAAGTAAFDPGSPESPTSPTSPESLVIEPALGEAGGLRPGVRKRLEETLRTIAATRGPSELEWVARGDDVTFLQLRPFRLGARTPVAEGAEREAPDPRRWRWDAAHNPLPLSPAQAGLVAVVDERCKTGLRQKVVGGYLFYARDASAPPASTEPAAAFRALEQAAAERLGRPAPSLEDAIETFVAVYEPLYGVVQPNAGEKRSALAAFLQRAGFEPTALLPTLLAGVPSAAGERARLAREVAAARSGEAHRSALAAYLDAFGDESPRWDVATPTWREVRETLERLVRDTSPASPVDAHAWRGAADAVAARLAPELRSEWTARLTLARAAAAVAEDDDVLYARIQAHVRAALVREGTRLVGRGVLDAVDDVFWLPLEAVRRDARGEAALSPEAARAEAAAARRADEAARANPPPLGATDAVAGGAGLLRGRAGAGGARIGRVWRHDLHGESSPTADTVLVARTLLPTELPLLSPAAIVVETGGALDHVAAQARERGIPAVVGAVGACDLLRDGDEVLVDGGAGWVVRLG